MHRRDTSALTDDLLADAPELRFGLSAHREPVRVTPPTPGTRRPGRGLSSIDEAIAAIRAGEVVIVVDDEDRENEGDFVMAAEAITPAAVNFMITEGRGLLCLSMTGERLDALEIPQMVPDRAGLEETAFTVSIDIERDGNTGISAAARAECIRAAIDPSTRPDDLRRPGHVFPLRARPGGVLERPGHTEASVDLARLAGLAPAGVICEIMNPDGTMARLPELLDLADELGLHLVTIEDLIEYRRRNEPLVSREADTRLPTDHGEFRAVGYRSLTDGVEHVALVYGDPGPDDALVRLHSECLTGDVLGSHRCDCGLQLASAMEAVAANGSGVVVYLRGHEGRGIGLVDKLRAYALQDGGADTVTANLELGHPADARDFTPGVQILRDLGIRSVRLLTNNPAKTAALAAHGLTVTERVPIETTPTPDNLAYLTTKRDKLGHVLRLDAQHTA